MRPSDAPGGNRTVQKHMSSQGGIAGAARRSSLSPLDRERVRLPSCAGTPRASNQRVSRARTVDIAAIPPPAEVADPSTDFDVARDGGEATPPQHGALRRPPRRVSYAPCSDLGHGRPGGKNPEEESLFQPRTSFQASRIKSALKVAPPVLCEDGQAGRRSTRCASPATMLGLRLSDDSQAASEEEGGPRAHRRRSVEDIDAEFQQVISHWQETLLTGEEEEWREQAQRGSPQAQRVVDARSFDEGLADGMASGLSTSEGATVEPRAGRWFQQDKLATSSGLRAAIGLFLRTASG